MKFLKFCLLPFVVLILVAVITTFIAPDSWAAEAEVVIDAKPEVIHPHLADLKQWETWAAWHRQDPALKSEYEGDPGVGMVSTWVDGEGMEGRNQLVESSPETGVVMETQIGEFPAFRATIAFEAQGDSTRVRWSSQADIPVGARVLLWMLPMDLGEAVSQNYTDGLNGLKELVETGEVKTQLEQR